MNTLTQKQAAVLELLTQAARRGEPAPTYREIADRLNVDVRSAFQHVEALEKKGVVARRSGRTRGIELTPEYAPPVGLAVVGRVAAGVPVLSEQNVEDYVDMRTLFAGEDAFLLKVRGDSMEDCRIFDGDFVLVRPRLRLDAGEIGVVAVQGEVTVKEVRYEPGRIVLISHNRHRSYPDQIYGRDKDIRIVGKVAMVFRFMR